MFSLIDFFHHYLKCLLDFPCTLFEGVGLLFDTFYFCLYSVLKLTPKIYLKYVIFERGEMFVKEMCFTCLLFPAITKTQSWKRKVESGKPGFDPGGVETDQFRQCHKIGKNKCCTFLMNVRIRMCCVARWLVHSAVCD